MSYKAYKIKLWGNGLKKWTVRFYLLNEDFGEGRPSLNSVLGGDLIRKMESDYQGHAIVPGNISRISLPYQGARAKLAVKRTMVALFSEYEQHIVHMVLDKLTNLTEEDIEFLEDKNFHIGKDMHDWFDFLEWIKLTRSQH